MATVITVAQQKGGAGKTTLVAQLAVALVRNHTVAVIDIDPQGSLSEWYKVRQGSLGAAAGGLHLSDISGWKLGPELDRLKNRYDYILIDSPPHAETDARAAIRSGDLIVVPVQPSPMDVWATRATIDLAAKERRKVLLVVNRLPPRGKLPEAMALTIQENGSPVAAVRLGNRQAFAASMLEGRGVVETDEGGTAAREIVALAEEVMALARR